MYHLVGDCSSTATEKKTTTKKYLLVRLVSNAISNTRKDMTAVRSKEEHLCVMEKSSLHNTNNPEIVLSVLRC